MKRFFEDATFLLTIIIIGVIAKIAVAILRNGINGPMDLFRKSTWR